MSAFVEWYRRACKKSARTNSHLQTIEARIAQLHYALNEQGRVFMATAQDLTKNLDDIKGLTTQLLELVTKRDEANADLKRQLADAIAKGSASEEEKNSLQRSLDEAFAASETAENELRAKIPGVPPVGGTGLGQSFADRAAFDAAWGAYSGPEGVTLDGQELKSGNPPPINYYSHSATGAIDTFGPSD